MYHNIWNIYGELGVRKMKFLHKSGHKYGCPWWIDKCTCGYEKEEKEEKEEQEK